jgi:hypothetical protein
MSSFADTEKVSAENNEGVAQASASPDASAAVDVGATESGTSTTSENSSSDATDAALEAIVKGTSEITVAVSSDVAEEAPQPFRMRKNVTLSDRQKAGHLSTGLQFDDPSMKM